MEIRTFSHRANVLSQIPAGLQKGKEGGQEYYLPIQASADNLLISKLQEPLDTLLSLNSRPGESIVNQSFHQMLLLSQNRALRIVMLCLFVSKLLALASTLAFIVCSTYSCVPQVTFRGKEGKLLTWLDYKAKEASCNTKAVGKGDLSYIYIYR